MRNHGLELFWVTNLELLVEVELEVPRGEPRSTSCASRKGKKTASEIPRKSNMIAAAHASAKEGRSEDQELEELQGMMGGVPRGMYIKLEQAQKNRDLADKVRATE